MRMPVFLRRTWQLLTFLSTLSWLFSIFGGLVIAALVTPATNAHGSYKVALFVGLLGAGTSLLLIGTRVGIALLPERLLRGQPLQAGHIKELSTDLAPESVWESIATSNENGLEIRFDLAQQVRNPTADDSGTHVLRDRPG